MDEELEFKGDLKNLCEGETNHLRIKCPQRIHRGNLFVVEKSGKQRATLQIS